MRWNIISPLLSTCPRYSCSAQPIRSTRDLAGLLGPKSFAKSFAKSVSTESNPSPTNANPPPTAIDSYFGRFPSFPYSPALPAANQFTRLCKAQKIRVPNVGLTEEGKKERQLFNEAVAEEFLEKFGDIEEQSREEENHEANRGENSEKENSEKKGPKEGDKKEDHEKKGHEEGREDHRQKWMHLAKVIEIDPIPQTITRFKKDMRTIWVNIYDVIQAARMGSSVRRFEGLKALARYSRSRKKVYPLAHAKQSSLRFLLKKISQGG